MVFPKFVGRSNGFLLDKMERCLLIDGGHKEPKASGQFGDGFGLFVQLLLLMLAKFLFGHYNKASFDIYDAG